MRFACIEYTTKTDRIWRPTPERPNYLCDPEREIDPTSFGCYTTALDGEHVPLTGLIYGSLEYPPSIRQRAQQDVARRFGGSFRPYNLNYLQKFDVLLVVYQMSNDDELVRFMQRVRKEFPDIIIVSCSSPPFGRLREYWKDHPETVERYRAFIRSSHFNMNVCRATVPWYRAFTDVPSLYLPQPYPVEYAMEQVGLDGPAKPDAPSGLSARAGTDPRAPRGESERAFPEPASPGLAKKARGAGELGPDQQQDPLREYPAGAQDGPPSPAGGPPIIYVAGDTVRPDIMSGHLVAKALQQRHPEFLIRVTKTPEFRLNTALLHGARYEVVPFRAWAEQLRELGTARLVINTDLWWTRGRVPVDCAAAGVPCVGTTSDGQTELWPDLAPRESIETDRLIELGERALSDTAFRTKVMTQAQRRLASYRYTEAVVRFSRAVTLARAGRLAEWRDPVWDGNRLRFP